MKRRFYATHKLEYRVQRWHLVYRLFSVIIDWIYPRCDVQHEVLPSRDETVIIVSNHCKLHGPIVFHLKYQKKGTVSIWATQELCYWNEATRYMMRDFFGGAPRWSRPFYWLFAIILTPLMVLLFRGAEVIPVFRDQRLLTTFRKTQEQLDAGKTVVIFPESPTRRSRFVNEFNPGFSDVAALYYRRSGGKIVHFYPAYFAPSLSAIRLGQPIAYDPNVPNGDQRSTINTYLMQEIERLAATLPEHEVINF